MHWLLRQCSKLRICYIAACCLVQLSVNAMSLSTTATTQHARLFCQSVWHTAVPDLQLAASDFLQTQYAVSLPAILGNFLPVLPLFLSTEGNLSFLAFPGLPTPYPATFLLDGRPLTDPAANTYALSWLSPEAIQHVDLFLGSRAVILSSLSQGVALNFRSFTYNSRYPYTRIWFAQSANFFTGSDATFSINLLPTLNVYAGYRHLSRDDVFPNSFLDLWNVRIGFRWQPDSAHTIIATDFFTNDYEGMNGGLTSPNFTQLPTPAIADVLFPTAQQRIYRHDLSINWQWQITPTFHLRTTVGYSPAEWNLKFFPLADSLGLQQRFSTLITAQSSFQYNAATWSAAVMAETQYRQRSGVPPSSTQHFNWAVGIWTTLRLLPIPISFGGRYFAFNGKFDWNAGLRFSFPSPAPWSAMLDLSTFANPLLPDSVERRHFLAIGELRFQTASVQWRQMLLYHKTAPTLQWTFNRITTDTDTLLRISPKWQPQNEIFGLAGTLQYQFHPHWQCQLQYGYNVAFQDSLVPPAFVHVRLQYAFTAFKHPVSLTLLATWLSHPFPYRFFPDRWRWVQSETRSQHLWNGLALYATVTFSSAVITIGVNNLLNQAFYTVPIYPDRGRSLDIIVRWAMQDRP